MSFLAWKSDTGLRSSETLAPQSLLVCSCRVAVSTLLQQRMNEVVKKACRRDRQAWAHDLATNIENDAANGRMRELYKTCRKFRHYPGRSTSNLSDCSGNLVSKHVEKACVFAEHFNRILNSSTHEDAPLDPDPEPEPWDQLTEMQRFLAQEPLVSEIEFCIQNLRSGRAAGKGGFAPEVLKAGGAEMVSWLHRMFSLVWASGKVPQAWKHCVMIALYKGAGDQADCNKYRGISLLHPRKHTGTPGPSIC